MLRQLLFGGFVSVINIAIHSLIMATVVGVAQRASAKNAAASVAVPRRRDDPDRVDPDGNAHD